MLCLFSKCVTPNKANKLKGGGPMSSDFGIKNNLGVDNSKDIKELFL